MIYIQSNTERTLPHHFDAASAMYGAIESALDYRLTSYEEVASGKFDSLIKTNLFVGSVEFMKEVFNRVGISDVKVPRNSNRDCKIMTLDEAHELAKTKKIFIKPLDIKLFTGLVLDGCIYSCLTGIPLDTEVMVYDVFDSPIESEWRCYIYKGEIVDARNYSGDFKRSPNYNYIENFVLEENKDTFPIAYTIDIGELSSGYSVVIEFNDMWAIGNYGMPNDLYLKLLKERYFEIINKNREWKGL